MPRLKVTVKRDGRPYRKTAMEKLQDELKQVAIQGTGGRVA